MSLRPRHPTCHPSPTSAATIMLFGILAPGKGQFHTVDVGGGSQTRATLWMGVMGGPPRQNAWEPLEDGSGLFLSLPRCELWGMPGHNDTANMGVGVLLFVPRAWPGGDRQTSVSGHAASCNLGGNHGECGDNRESFCSHVR